MTDDPLAPDVPTAAELDEVSDVEVLDAAEAAGEVERAVAGRRGIARRYLLRIRRRNPDATPAQVIAVLERHYLAAISAAGAVVTVGSLAAEIGISLIPGGGVAAKGGKVAARTALKSAGKGLLKNAAKTGGEQALTKLVPAGDKQLQFEVTGLFALALAELYSFDLDEQESAELVQRLTDEDPETGRSATDMIGSLVSADDEKNFRSHLNQRQGKALDVGSEAFTSGARRFVFGRAVVQSAREAFGDAPDDFPAYLAVPEHVAEEEPSRGLAALERAARSVGDTAGTRAQAFGAGISSAADSATRPLRRVDLDGDGIPDEAAALTAAKNAGSAVAARTGAVGKKLSAPLAARRRRGREDAPRIDSDPTDQGGVPDQLPPDTPSP